MAGDAISVAPHNYKTIFENDRVRLLEYSGKAGDKTEMHSHPDILAYPLTAAKVKFTLPNGQSFEAEMQAGEAMFQGGARPQHGAPGRRRSRPALRAEVGPERYSTTTLGGLA
jgi:hypothetical protein